MLHHMLQKNVKELMENVDLAVYHVKHSGKNGIQVFDTMFRNNKNENTTKPANIFIGSMSQRFMRLTAGY